MNTTNQIQKTPEPAQFQALDAIADRALAELSAAQGSFAKAFAVSTAMNDLRTALKPLMGQFMKLQNTPLGFKTDKPDGGYPEHIVCDAVIEGTLRGVQTVGNQFNIIATRCYITKEGYEYKLQRMKGLTKLKINIGVPALKEGGAIVECSATWAFNGVDDSKEAKIPVRVNAGMGADAIIGKAQRKFMKRIYEQITGSPEPDDAELEEAKALPEPKTPLLDAQVRRETSNVVTDSVTAAAQTPQQKLEAWAVENGYTWDETHGALLNIGFLSDPVKSFAEIPNEPATRALRATKGLVAELQKGREGK